jgi:ribosome-binding protein aMBF1 (putative translation factor)
MFKGLNMKKKTKDAATIIDRMIGNDRQLRALIDQESVNAKVARSLYAARTSARLTQSQLAKLVGTTQSVIARLEDADYEGHSLSMLKRIADALGKRVEIRLTSSGRRRTRKAVA